MSLTIDYTLLQPNTGSFLDWSQLCVDGYNSSCGQVHCFQEPVQVSVARADYSIDITGIPRELSSCIAFNLTINLNKNSPDDDPKWIGHDMNLTFNDSNYRYIGPATIKGINNYPSVPGSPNPNPTITGNNVTWFLGKNVSRGGNITFKVQKRCPLDQNAFATLNYTDNCGGSLIRTATAFPSLMTFPTLEILKTPELIYALNKNLSWNIQVVNTGSGTAYNVSLFDKLDTGLKYNDSKIGSCLSCPFVNDPSNTSLLSPNRVIWKLGNLTPKQEVWVKLNATIIGCNNLNNWAYARQGCGGMECQNISAHSRVELVNAQILAAKHDVGLVDDCGSNTTFFIQIRNGGPVAAYNVTVNDTLPAGLKLNGTPVVTGLTPTSEDYSGNPLVWKFDQPQGWSSGTDIIITFNATVKGPCTFQGGNSVVTINYKEPCGRSGPEVDSLAEVQKAQPQLTISKTPSTVYANNGDIVHWTVALNNIGNYEAKNVTLYDILPINTAFSSCNPPETGGTGTSADPLVWKLPVIPKGSGATILVNATVTGCGVPGNNNATVSYRCCPTSATSKSVLVTQPSVVTPNIDFHGGLDTCGGNITLVIRNDGATASIKNITEIMPAGFVYKKLSAVITSNNATHGATIVNYEPIDYSSINRTLIWNSTNVDKIYPGETISIKFRLINCVSCCSSVITSNNNLKVNVTDSCGDPFFTRRSDGVTPRKAVLSVRKEPSVQHLGNVKWTLYIDNKGDEAASNVSITDVLGDGFTNIVVQPNDGTQFHNKPYPNFTTINWTHQTVPKGIGTWQRVITARANDTCGLNHTNNVTVRGTCPLGCVYSNTSTIAYAWSSAVYELDSMETMLRGQTDLISSFEALLKSTPLDANDSVKFLNSFDDLSSRQQLELNSFESIIRCNWYDLNQSQRIKLSSSFEDLLRRQSNILSSNDDLLKMGFCKLSADNKTLFLSNFESRIEYEQTLLISFTNLINRQGNLKTSEVQVWNSFLASLEDLIRRQSMILASFQELSKFSCDGSHLTIFKEVNTTSVSSGGHVRYNITVTNTGDKNITNITINDYILGVIQAPPGITLLPGQNKTYSNITKLNCTYCSNCQCVVCNFATACGNVTGTPQIPICTVSNDVCVNVSQLSSGHVYPGVMNEKPMPSAVVVRDPATTKSVDRLGSLINKSGGNQGTKCSVCGSKAVH